MGQFLACESTNFRVASDDLNMVGIARVLVKVKGRWPSALTFRNAIKEKSLCRTDLKKCVIYKVNSLFGLKMFVIEVNFWTGVLT